MGTILMDALVMALYMACPEALVMTVVPVVDDMLVLVPIALELEPLELLDTGAKSTLAPEMGPDGESTVTVTGVEVLAEAIVTKGLTVTESPTGAVGMVWGVVHHASNEPSAWCALAL